MNPFVNVAALTFAGIAVTASAQPAANSAAPASAQPAANSADARFEALYQREWQWRQAQFGGGEDDERVRDRLPDVTPDAQVDYDVYRYQIESLAAAQRFREWEKPVNSDSSFWGDLAYSARRQMRTEEEYRNYIKMLRDMPRYFREQTANMRAGLARGFTAPRITLEGRDASLASVAEAASPEQTVYY